VISDKYINSCNLEKNVSRKIIYKKRLTCTNEYPLKSNMNKTYRTIASGI